MELNLSPQCLCSALTSPGPCRPLSLFTSCTLDPTFFTGRPWLKQRPDPAAAGVATSLAPMATAMPTLSSRHSRPRRVFVSLPPFTVVPLCLCILFVFLCFVLLVAFPSLHFVSIFPSFSSSFLSLFPPLALLVAFSCLLVFFSVCSTFSAFSSSSLFLVHAVLLHLFCFPYSPVLVSPHL